MMMKILITGAHFTPAVAVIEELRKMDSQAKVVYVGRKTTQEGDKSLSVESKVLPTLGIKFIPIISGRLQRYFSIYTIPSLFKIPIGFIQAIYILLSEKPDVILSFGGYVALPSVIVGWLFSIPIIVHEQTLVSGLANKISSLFADKICVSFPTQNPKAVLTGNPLRKEIIESLNRHHHKGVKILITGGNQGSHIINLAVEKSLDKLTKLASIVHVTGDNKFDDFERLEKLQSDRYIVKKWIGEDWGRVLKQSDLVVSRAGINTLSELAYLSLPALVIPIPYLYQDEQNKNARFFQELNLVRILPQSKLTPKTLYENIKNILDNLKKLKENAGKAKKIIIPDSAKRVALETIILAKKEI